MKITLYFINWNDSFYLPFIKEHYGKFCQRIVMYDNYSTDGSQGLAGKLGFEVRVFGYHGMLNDQAYLDVKNNCWKEERGKGVDYVIVCDADEFVKPTHAKGNFPRMMGFNMVSNYLPIRSIWDINTGAPDPNYAKQAIFNPDEVQEIAYVHGCHKNNAVVENKTERGVCELYHFRQIGGLQRMLDRHAVYRGRLSKFNLKHNMGHHYGRPEWTPDQLAELNKGKEQEWIQLQHNAAKLWESSIHK